MGCRGGLAGKMSGCWPSYQIEQDRPGSMNILYHITNLPPKMPGTEASLQELNVLRDHFGGNLVHLNPNQHSPIYLPRLLFGFHQLKQIRRLEDTLHFHHLYNADPFPFPFVRWLRQPLIYSKRHWKCQRTVDMNDPIPRVGGAIFNAVLTKNSGHI